MSKRENAQKQLPRRFSENKANGSVSYKGETFNLC